MGADQRLARRDRQRREDPEARRVRSLLHRELVSAVRSLHSAEDAAGTSDQERERLLERFRAKWVPVRVKRTRLNKNLERGSDSIRTARALTPFDALCSVS